MQPATQAYVADRLPAGFAATPMSAEKKSIFVRARAMICCTYASFFIPSARFRSRSTARSASRLGSFSRTVAMLSQGSFAVEPEQRLPDAVGALFE
jgi:hypothetical protein